MIMVHQTLKSEQMVQKIMESTNQFTQKHNRLQERLSQQLQKINTNDEHPDQLDDNIPLKDKQTIILGKIRSGEQQFESTLNQVLNLLDMSFSEDRFHDYVKIFADYQQGLTNPICIAINDGYLYVSNHEQDQNTAHISKISLKNPKGEEEETQPFWLNCGDVIKSPSGIAIYNDYMFVCDIGKNAIFKVNLVGQPVIEKWSQNHEKLRGPSDILINAGFVWVTNYNDRSITKINISDPTNIENYPSNMFFVPTGMTIKDDQLFISNWASHNIVKMDLSNPEGSECLQKWADEDNQGIYCPKGIAIYDGYLYICNTTPYNHSIKRIDFSAVGEKIICEQWISQEQGIRHPSSLVFHEGFAYVCCAGQKILKIKV